MVDWKGLLNWSLSYQDGTKPSEFKQMSEEDRKFLEDAFESVCINEMKEIWKILDTIKTREGDSEKEIEERCDLLEELSGYIDGPENARNIVRGKRFNELISYFFESKHKKVLISLGRIITQMMQNDGYVQKAAKDLQIFRFLQKLNDEQDQEVVNMYIYMLTGILFGDEVEVREHFVVQLNGIVLLHNMLIKQKGNVKNVKRILTIFSDLTKVIDEHAKKGIPELRKKTIEKIKEIKLYLMFIDMLKEYDYQNLKNVDIIHFLCENIVNIADVYEKISDVYDSIKELNKSVNSSPSLTEEEKKEEKSYLIDVIKRIKLRIEDSKKEPKKEESHEVKMLGSKESMRIELKK